MNTQQQNTNGGWEEAVQEPYYPNLIEKIAHYLGHHIFPEYPSRMFLMDGSMLPRQCLICGKTEDGN